MVPASTNKNNHGDIRANRIKEMSSTAENELQELFNEAAEYQKMINNSKTQTKKLFYTKKFRKVQSLILQAAHTIHYLKQLQESSTKATEETIVQGTGNDTEEAVKL